MSGLDDDIMGELIAESQEHLQAIEPDLLELENLGNDVSPDLVNRIFRAMHSIKGGFGFFGLTHIKELSHTMESVLMKVRDGEISVYAEMVDALLAGVDKLNHLIEEVHDSEDISIEEELAPLQAILAGETLQSAPAQATQTETAPTVDPPPQEMMESAPEVPSAKPATVGDFELSPEQLQQMRGPGRHLFAITVRAMEDLKANSRTGADLFQSMNDLGEILHQEGAELEKLEESGIAQCRVIFATVLEKDLAAGTFELPEELFEEITLTQKDAAETAPAPEPSSPPKAQEKKDEPAQPPAENKRERRGSKDAGSDSIRVRVDLLNDLMNLAGELVLGRNQLKQALDHRLQDTVASNSALKHFTSAMEQSRDRITENMLDIAAPQNGAAEQIRSQVQREFERLQGDFLQAMQFKLMDIPGLNSIVQNVDLVTSELQGGIMNTRMQPVGSVFSKFPRIIRDMAKKLEKEIELTVEGKEVELDKSIVEALGDPLTHLIRNSCDHGIERPEIRKENGKDPIGQVLLKAYHEGGQVNIDIVDDGGGIDPEKLRKKAIQKNLLTEEEARRMNDREALALIFAPGLSTAEKVSDLSGRGVGMDVVKTNIEKLGGVVELDSTLGKGTRLNLKLPLTLAIIPSLTVTVNDRIFAVPQVNLEELVRVRAAEVSQRIENIQGKAVLRLREKLLPLLRLSDVLGLERSYLDPRTGVARPDRRERLTDRRDANTITPTDSEEQDGDERQVTDRRRHYSSALHVLVLKVGANRYGLIVDQLLDNEEIVVKPLSSYLKDCKCYSGATIMGDGSVAMILDGAGIAEQAGLHFGGDIEEEENRRAEDYQRQSLAETQSILLFRNNTSELFAINLTLVARIEKIQARDVEKVGDKEYLKYEDYSLRLLRLHNFLAVKKPDSEPEEFHVLVPKLVRHPMGIVIGSLEDILQTNAAIDRTTLSGTGIMGSMVVDRQMAIILDIYSLFEAAEPDIYESHKNQQRVLEGKRILLAEDTAFFRTVEKQYLQSLGCEVHAVEDGQEAWQNLQDQKFDVLVTDIVMPRLNGIELSKRLRANQQFADLPIIALTSLQNDSDRKAIEEAGVDAYEVKLDKEHLRQTLIRIMSGQVMER